MLKIVLKPHRHSLKAGQMGEQKIFAMLKLIPDAETAQSRPPLALCLVIDTSASMQAYADQDAAKSLVNQHGLRGQSGQVDGAHFTGFELNLPTLLEQAIQAAHAMVDDARLAPTDLVSIIHFDDDAHTLLPLTPLSQKDAAHQAIESLRDYAGGTHMAPGLRRALDELRRVPPETAKRAFVFTDGAAFDEDECVAQLAEFAEINAPLIGIGIGDEYNEELLKQMADATQARPYHLRDMTALMNEVLPAEIGQTIREVVTDLKVAVATVKGVRLDAAHRAHPSLSEIKSDERPLRLGNVAAGDYTVFILEMTISGVERPPSRARIAQIGLTAHAPGLGRVQEFPPQNLFVEFTHDEAAVATVDPEVIGYVQQKNVGRMVEDAMKMAPTDAAKARQTLQLAAGMTQRIGNTAVTQMLDSAINELERTGTISIGTNKTVALGLRTKTVKTASLDEGAPGGLSPEELRRLSGT